MSKDRIFVAHRIKKVSQLTVCLIYIMYQVIYLVYNKDSYSNERNVILLVQVGDDVDKNKRADYDEDDSEKNC